MSVATTNLGQLASLQTVLADPAGPMHLFLDSATTLTGAGTNVLSGTNTLSGAITSSGGLSVTGGMTASSVATFSDQLVSTSTIDQSALSSVFLSKQTTASYTSLTLADGEMSIGSVSVASATIYFRSGVTIYEFDAQASGVL